MSIDQALVTAQQHPLTDHRPQTVLVAAAVQPASFRLWQIGNRVGGDFLAYGYSNGCSPMHAA